MKEWMSIENLSEYLQVPQTKIQHLVKKNMIPFYDKLGSIRFFRTEIDDWMRTPMEVANHTDHAGTQLLYRSKNILAYTLTCSKILIGPKALNRLPMFIKKTIALCQENDRPFLYRAEFDPILNNFNDYLRLCCQIGLIDNKNEGKKIKHYYPTSYAERISATKDLGGIKQIILDCILDIVKNNLESLPNERHAIYLLWYTLKLKQMETALDESLYNKGGETTSFPNIRRNYSIGFCDFLFGNDQSKEQGYLEKWDMYINTANGQPAEQDI